MIAPPNINEVDDRWGGARSLIPMYTLDYLDDELGGEVIQLINIGRGNHFKVILFLFSV